MAAFFMVDWSVVGLEVGFGVGALLGRIGVGNLLGLGVGALEGFAVGSGATASTSHVTDPRLTAWAVSS